MLAKSCPKRGLRRGTTRAIPLLGRTFGKLTVEKRVGTKSNGAVMWRCRCECGGSAVTDTSTLLAGKIRACPCAWRRTFAETKICPRCNQEKPHAEFRKASVSSGSGLHSHCRPCSSAKSLENYRADTKPTLERLKRMRNALKAEVLLGYGGACTCCGEREPAFLAVDHIDGGGNKHRKNLKLKGEGFYKWVIANGFPKTLQILCHNCNWAKHVNGGVCPHKRIGG